MAPENASLPKRKPKEGQYLFDLGVKGRKTGLTLPDTGIRDEHGLEPMDHLFSSPAKPNDKSVKRANGTAKNLNATLTSEEDMDVGDSTIPEPTDVIAERKQASMRLPPRSKSPIKTYLKSPARRNPSVGLLTSPSRGAKVVGRAASTSASVVRRLDFSTTSFDESQNLSANYTSPGKRGGSAMPSISTTKLTNGSHLQPGFSHIPDDPDLSSILDDAAMLNDEDAFQLIDDAGYDDTEVLNEEQEDAPEEVSEMPEPELAPLPSKKGKGKGKVVQAKQIAKKGRSRKEVQPVLEEDDEEEEVENDREENADDDDGEEEEEPVVEPVKKKGRPKKVQPSPQEEEVSNLTVPSPEVQKLAKKKLGRPKKVAAEEEPAPSPISSPEVQKLAKKQSVRGKRPAEVEKEEEEEDLRPAKRTRRSLDGLKAIKPKAKATRESSTIGQPKPRGRKPKLATVPETDSPIIQRGPPIPRNNIGLFITRRETPMEGTGFKQTRSGRNSIKPVSYWKGEKVEYDTDMTEDPFGKRRFLMTTIKEVVRTDEVAQPKRRTKAKSRGQKAKKRAETESEDEADIEPWEVEPGFINGEVRVWNPVDQLGSESEEVEADIAFSAGAIVTTQIPHASFRFAKTLTLPFFGSGMVDLPPGGIKKQKNSRKMQMVFFVHRGRVQVTVNDTAFRIGQGGMWQVPRGNFYSIENDYDKEARIFFSQGCELVDSEGSSAGQ